MKITKTKHGLRLSQHGVVISEMRLTPGPTHSVFDVLAGLVAVFQPRKHIGLLGFAGGGMLAPLRALRVESVIRTVDLDAAGFELFQRHCRAWTGGVQWQQAEASAWLRRQKRPFDLVIEDLSVPENGDVFKPEVSWKVLPGLIHRRLAPGGVAVFNLLKPVNGRWFPLLDDVAARFASVRLVRLDEFENVILVAGSQLPAARALSTALRERLRVIHSRQASRVHVSTG